MTTDPPTPPILPPKKSIWTRWWMIILYVIVGIIVLASVFSSDDEGDVTGAATTTTVDEETTTTDEEDVTSTVGPTTTMHDATTTQPPTTTTTATGRTAIFGSGIHEIGVDISAGVYETGLIGEDDLFDGCYWERLSGFSGEFEDIITNANPTVHSMIEIEATDVGFNNDCGDWYDVEVLEELLSVIPPGTWALEVHFAAGTYQAPGGDACYWERLSGLNGDFDSIIANDLPTGAAIVEISASDVAFTSGGCGEWTRR